MTSGVLLSSEWLILEVKRVKKGGHRTVSDTGRGGQRRADCHEPGQGASRGQCSEVFRYLIFLVEAEEEEQDSGSESGILGRLEDSEAFTQEASVVLSTWSQTWV